MQERQVLAPELGVGDGFLIRPGFGVFPLYVFTCLLFSRGLLGTEAVFYCCLSLSQGPHSRHWPLEREGLVVWFCAGV